MKVPSALSHPFTKIDVLKKGYQRILTSLLKGRGEENTLLPQINMRPTGGPIPKTVSSMSGFLGFHVNLKGSSWCRLCRHYGAS